MTAEAVAVLLDDLARCFSCGEPYELDAGSCGHCGGETCVGRCWECSAGPFSGRPR